jgi:hypothetical protein
MSQLVENERAKLTANWLNAIAGGLMTAGVVTPLVAFGLGLLGPTVSVILVFAITFGCGCTSIALQVMGLRVLRRLM